MYRWVYFVSFYWDERNSSEPVAQKALWKDITGFKPVCRDSSEIYHCLLFISFGKSQFQPPNILAQQSLYRHMSGFRQAKRLRDIYFR
jgi:hypothetical protein